MSGDEHRLDPWRTGPASTDEEPGGTDPAPPRREPEASEITFEQIRERAYDLWERNHRPEGMEIQFWLVAERELRAERERRQTPRSEGSSEAT